MEEQRVVGLRKQDGMWRVFENKQEIFKDENVKPCLLFIQSLGLDSLKGPVNE